MARGTSATNPFETIGRAAKARAIARAIWHNTPRTVRTDRGFPAAVSDIPAEDRLAWAEHAAQKKPSDATWAVVVEVIREFVEDERRYMGQLEDPRASA